MKKSQLKQLIQEVIQENEREYLSFQLTIKLGNEAATFETVPDMLREVAKKIEAGRDSGRIMDINGNGVGGFAFDR